MKTAHSLLFELAAGTVLAMRRELVEMLPGALGASYADVRELAIAAASGKRSGAPSMQTEGGTAVINVVGPIARRDDMCTALFGGTSIDSIRGQLQEALSAPAVDSILLYIDSPGGAVDGVADLADELFHARTVKPIAAYVDATGASAAYWLATAAQQVTVSQSGFVGSIGVYATHIDTTAADEQAGKKRMRIISSKSPMKALEPTTPEGEASLQQRVDAIAELFITAVARQRGVTAARVEETFGQGDVVMGAEAVARGMADQVGTVADALTWARRMAGHDRMRAEDTLLYKGSGDTQPGTQAAHDEASAGETPAGGAAEDARKRERVATLTQTKGRALR
jgi:signal peptide peptidase SppA